MSKRRPRYLVVTVHTPYDSESTVHLQLYTFAAEHPEIAYELSMQLGRETCFGRRFEGLGHLGETEHRVVRIWKAVSGSPDEFVADKEELEAFANCRGSVAPCDESLFLKCTSEPPFRMALEELDATPWYQFEHAHGNAFDIPKALRRLSSVDPIKQTNGIDLLYESICHCSSLYSATVPAVLPLLNIVANPILDRRAEIAELFVAITKSAVTTPTDVQAKWGKLAALAQLPVETHHGAAERDLAARIAVREEIVRHFSAISDLAIDRDPSVATRFQQVVALLSQQ